MPIVFIVMLAIVVVGFGLLYLSDDFAPFVCVMGSANLIGCIIFSFAAPYRFTDILIMPAVAKLPTAVVIEATIDGHVVRETKTDAFTYLHIGQPGTQTVYRQQYNAWGLEVNQDSGFVVKVVGP